MLTVSPGDALAADAIGWCLLRKLHGFTSDFPAKKLLEQPEDAMSSQPQMHLVPQQQPAVA